MLWACRRPRSPRFGARRESPETQGRANRILRKTAHAASSSRTRSARAGCASRAGDFQVHRVSLLAVPLIAVGADVAVDGDLIADVHLVDQESPDLLIEGEGGEEFRPLFPLARLSVVQNSSTATVTTVFGALPANCRGFCETLPEMTKKLREVMKGSGYDGEAYSINQRNWRPRQGLFEGRLKHRSGGCFLLHEIEGIFAAYP